MKRIFLSAAAVAAVLAVGACNKSDNTGANGSVGASDTPGQNSAVNAAQDATAGAVGMASASTLGANTTDGFVNAAAIGDMYEIEAGKMAQKMGKAAGVKEFGAMMVKDHTATSAKLKSTLPTSGATVTPPTVLDERRQGMIDNLKAAGDNFDSVYLTQQAAAHNEMLTLMRGYADNGDNAALKALAAATAPKVQMHLDQVNKLQGANGGADTAAH